MKSLSIKRHFAIGLTVSICSIALFGSAVFAFDARGFSGLKQNTTQKTILLAKKNTNDLQKDIPTYQVLMKDAMDQLFAVTETIVKNPSLSRSEKEQKVHQFIMSVRFGPEKKDTFSAMTIQGVMLTEPYKPHLVKKDLIKLDYGDGFFFIAEMIKIAREQGEGFVSHLWPMYEGEFPVPAISFVRLHPELLQIMITTIGKADIEAYEGPATLVQQFGLAPNIPNASPNRP